LTYESIKSLSLDFLVYKDGLAIDREGHVEVVNGQQKSLALSRVAVALCEDDVFS
jgi:hypothetical protein